MMTLKYKQSATKIHTLIHAQFVDIIKEPLWLLKIIYYLFILATQAWESDQWQTKIEGILKKLVQSPLQSPFSSCAESQQ